MPYCIMCGAKAADDACFCEECGAPIERDLAAPAPEPAFAPTSGSVVVQEPLAPVAAPMSEPLPMYRPEHAAVPLYTPEHASPPLHNPEHTAATSYTAEPLSWPHPPPVSSPAAETHVPAPEPRPTATPPAATKTPAVITEPIPVFTPAEAPVPTPPSVAVPHSDAQTPAVIPEPIPAFAPAATAAPTPPLAATPVPTPVPSDMSEQLQAQTSTAFPVSLNFAIARIGTNGSGTAEVEATVSIDSTNLSTDAGLSTIELRSTGTATFSNTGQTSFTEPVPEIKLIPTWNLTRSLAALNGKQGPRFACYHGPFMERGLYFITANGSNTLGFTFVPKDRDEVVRPGQKAKYHQLGKYLLVVPSGSEKALLRDLLSPLGWVVQVRDAEGNTRYAWSSLELIQKSL